MRKQLPIMLGVGELADKCCIIGKRKGLSGYSLFICRLLCPVVREKQEIPDENIHSVICELHFCRTDAARMLRDSLDDVIFLMERTEADGQDEQEGAENE